MSCRCSSAHNNIIIISIIRIQLTLLTKYIYQCGSLWLIFSCSYPALHCKHLFEVERQSPPPF